MSEVGVKLFRHMDGPNGNGIITWDEFLPVIKKIGWDDQTAIRMWYAVDKDRSMSLDRDEFIGFCQLNGVSQYIAKYESTLGPVPPMVGEKAFAIIDGPNGNGVVSFDEFFPLILKIGWNQQTAMKMWQYQDTDHSGTLSKGEFLKFCNRPDVKPYMHKCEQGLPNPPGFGVSGGFGAPTGGFGAPGGGSMQTQTQTYTSTSNESKEEKVDDSDWYNEKCERDVDGDAAEEDAKALRKAMKGFGTNEKAINEVLAPKSKAEIQAIRSAFASSIGRDLIKDFKSETSGNYENLLVALTLAPDEYDAMLIRKAVKGMGTNETVLSEVLATRSPAEITAMQKAYSTLYKGREMITDIENDTSGNLEKVYCMLLRNERSVGTSDTLSDHVTQLYKAGEKKLGTDEGVFIRILAGYDRSYVEKIYWKYAEAHGKALDKVVSSEFSGNLKNVLKALCTPIEILMSRKMKNAMKGMGTDDDDLVRCIATMKERCLRKIAKQFLQDTQKTLYKWVQGDTSGDYGKLMAATVKHWGNVS